MARKLSPKTLAKQQDALIEQIYRKHCSGMQINVLDIPVLFKMARGLLDRDTPHDKVGEAMVSFVHLPDGGATRG